MIGLAGLGAVSYRKELLIVGGVLSMILCLPILAVVTIANAGSNTVSESLVTVNLSTKTVDIYNPAGNYVSSVPVTSTWPVGGVVTTEFATPHTPWQAYHTGIDIADPRGKIGRPVTVFMEGTVTKVVNTDNEYGKYVFVEHGNHIVSQYWHLNEATTTVGSRVRPGDVVGLEGSTGRSTGPHLHFEIQVYGLPVNPRVFIEGDPPRGN